MSSIRIFLSRFRTLVQESGQTMAEYAVVLGVISASVIVAFTALSGGVRNAIDNAATIIKSLG